jgi:hypothetical protein
MSFFKKFTDKLTSPKATVLLKINKNSFVLGENVEGTLSISSNEDFDATEIRCEIVCNEEAKRTRREYDGNLNREVTRDYRETVALYSAKPTVSGAMKVTKDLVKDFPCTVNIPAGGRPTFLSVDNKVSWSLKAVIAVDGRPDVTSRPIELQVLAPTASPVIREREVIREVVMIPCKYCGGLMPQTETTCPNCGAKRTG